jgi:hypothetical protein
MRRPSVSVFAGLIIAAFATLALRQEQRPNIASIPAQGDEFVGPFPSWTNVKTESGAKGDGAADDTAALQRAFDAIGTKGHSSVLYFPAGTYRLTSTVALVSRIYVSIVGEDPATTRIVWDGSSGGTMFRLQGVAYSRLGRLTFEGKARASIAIDQTMVGGKNYFDTGNEYADVRVVDTEYGIRGGWLDAGFAETTIRRAQFIRNTKAGVALGNFNALDIWVWDSLFEDCGTGVTNYERAGNFRVYRSIFRRSKTADMLIGNTGGFSARENYSIGSKAFFVAAATNNPATISIQGNTIIDSLNPTPIAIANQGPGVIVDNTIRSSAGATGPVLKWTNPTGADLLSAGNVFTVASPIQNNGRLITLGDRVVARAMIRAAEPNVAAALPRLGRKVFEVPPGADAAEIQSVIAAATRETGRRPVVHFPEGVYSIASTLMVPASDLHLVGDGFTTELHWTGPAGQPAMRLLGPSRVTMQDLRIDGSEKTDALAVTDVDQSGSRIYMDQVQTTAALVSNLVADHLDHAVVMMENCNHGEARGASIKLTGGPLLSTGRNAEGRLLIFSGASSNNRLSYEISDGGKLLMRDSWYETSWNPGFASVQGRATVTIEGARIALPVTPGSSAIEIRDLNGRVTIMTSQIDDRVLIAGHGTNSQVLGLGLVLENKDKGYVQNAASPPGLFALVSSRQVVSSLPGVRTVATPNDGPATPAFIARALEQTRQEKSVVLRALPPGVTDVRLFRVAVTHGTNNIVISSRRQ